VEKKQIESKIRDIIAKHLPQGDPDKITPQAEFAALGLDSLALSWIVADVEDAFGFEMQISDIMKLKTVAAAVEYVERRLAG